MEGYTGKVAANSRLQLYKLLTVSGHEERSPQKITENRRCERGACFAPTPSVVYNINIAGANTQWYGILEFNVPLDDTV